MHVRVASDQLVRADGSVRMNKTDIIEGHFDLNPSISFEEAKQYGVKNLPSVIRWLKERGYSFARNGDKYISLSGDIIYCPHCFKKFDRALADSEDGYCPFCGEYIENYYWFFPTYDDLNAELERDYWRTR